MKTKFLLSLIILLVFNQVVLAQSNNDENSYDETISVKTAPFALGVGVANVVFELPINSNTTFSVSGLYAPNFLGSNIGAIQIGGDFRFYLTNKGEPSGFYLGPSVAFSQAFVNSEDDDRAGVTLSFGGTLGYQWIFGGGFVLDLGAGGAYAVGSEDISNNRGVYLSTIHYVNKFHRRSICHTFNELMKYRALENRSVDPKRIFS